MKQQKSVENRKEKVFIASAAVISIFAAALLAGRCVMDAIELMEFLGLLLTLVYAAFCITAAVFLSVLFHELGHLVFGLLTGYELLIFRLWNWMLVRVKGKMQYQKYYLAGTPGQCTMSPPKGIWEGMPTALYNMGGVLGNLALFLLTLLGVVLIPAAWIRMFLGTIALASLWLAVENGIPVRLGDSDNDGCHQRTLNQFPKEATRAFRIQLKVMQCMSYGVRLKDLPDEWFERQEGMPLSSDLFGLIELLACNREMERGELKKAEDRLDALEKAEGLSPLLRYLTLVDLASCRMLLGEPIEDLDGRLGKGGRKFLKNRDKVLSVQRMSYMIAMFYEDNQAKGAKIWLEFEMVARWQPFDPQVLMDRELIETAWEQYRKMKGIQKG